jgi:hypothetical protein
MEAVVVTVGVKLESGVKVSLGRLVAAGISVFVVAGAGVSTATTRVGVGSASNVTAAIVAATAASVACASITGATVGSAGKGNGIQALNERMLTTIRTAVRFMAGSFILAG